MSAPERNHPFGGQPVHLVACSGGRARRWSGRDKTAADLAGRPVLLVTVSTALAAPAVSDVLAGVVVVADPGHPARRAVDAVAALAGAGPARWVREDPPHTGPVAALAAALEAVGAGPPDAVLLVLAGDAPFAGGALPRLLDAVRDGAAAAVGRDPDGRRQPLLAAYRTSALARALAGLPGGPQGAALRDLVAGMTVVEVPVTATEALDLDTPADLERALRLLPDAPRPRAASQEAGPGPG